MTKKKILAILCAILIVSVSLAMPVSAQQASIRPVTYSNGMIQPFWVTVNADVYLTMSKSGNTVKSQVIYSLKNGAVVTSISNKIYEQAPNSSSWTLVKTSSAAESTYSGKQGYCYMSESTVKITLNGTPETFTNSSTTVTV